MPDLLVRFIIGGAIVTAFAMLSDVLRPKSFAGLFGAAPSVALATLGLTVRHQGKAFAAIEAHSMIAGAIAFLVYASLTTCVLRRFRTRALATTICLMPVWFLAAFGLYILVRGAAA